MRLEFTRDAIYTQVRFYDTPYGTIAEYLAAIRDATSARPKGYQHMPRYRAGTWDGYIRLFKNNAFPSGLMLRVLEAVQSIKHPMEIGVVRQRPTDQYTDRYRPITPDMLHGITLRDYQVEAAKTLLQHAVGVAKMATNSGKTEVMAAICASYPGKVLILTTKRELMYQTSERLVLRLGEPVGCIGDSKDQRERVTVSMIQTLGNHDNLEAEFADMGCVMFDECFVAGTTIDGKPIESIEIGSFVTAFDPITHALSRKRVTNVFRRPAPELLYRITDLDGNEVVCTGNHPFFTYNWGWMPASILQEGDCIGRAPRDIVRAHAPLQCRAQGREQEAHAGEQPNTLLGRANENRAQVEVHESQASGSWWEWNAYARTAGQVVRSAWKWMGGRILRALWRGGEGEALANPLQDRPGAACTNGSCGSRRLVARGFECAGRGFQEGKVLDWGRVAGVEVIERGRDGRYERLCPGNTVYNLEVEDWHTYVANGFVAHNCHHVQSTTAQSVMMRVAGWNRFGFSGTPLHYDDLDDMTLIGSTGPICVDITNADLIEAGVSAMPYVDMYVVHEDKGFKDGWEKSYTNYIVGNDNRNGIICKVVQEAHAQAALILVDRLEHGHKLQKAIPGSIFAHGSLPTEERRAILDRLREGNGTIVIATPIFDEGVDVPSVDLLVLAAGGETHIRLLQRIGRGMRRKDSNTLKVVDFVDDTNQYLLNHSKSRAELYEREGFAVRIVE